MKIGLFSLLIIFSLSVTSQTSLPNNFKIGDYVEIFGEDSIKIFFNCTGVVVDKKCAEYYRVGKMDTSAINVTGSFYDYDINDKMFFKAIMLNNNLEGFAQYYHPNGKVLEEGNYENNIRQGKWKFYYPDGSLEKVYEYVDGEPIVWEVYSSDGNATVVNGNGNFKTAFSLYKQCHRFEAYGQLLNGKKTGKWTFSNLEGTFKLNRKVPLPIGTETYADGDFIKGRSKNYEYTENPKIVFTIFYASEELSLLENFTGCPGDSFHDVAYDKKHPIESFYPDLQQKLVKYEGPVKNQWLVVGITISDNDKVDEVNVASSINDTNLEEYIYGLLTKMTRWKTAVVNSKKIVSNVFVTILVDNNQIIVPKDYIRRNSGN